MYELTPEQDREISLKIRREVLAEITHLQSKEYNMNERIANAAAFSQQHMGHIGRSYANADGPGTFFSPGGPLPPATPYGRRADDQKTHPGYGTPMHGIEMTADGLSRAHSDVMRESTLHGEDKPTERPLDTIMRFIAKIEDILARLHVINDELAGQLADEREKRHEAEAMLTKRLDGLHRTASEWSTHTPFNT